MTTPKSSPPAAWSTTPRASPFRRASSPSTGSATVTAIGADRRQRLNYPYSPEFPHLLGANCSFRRRTLIELGGFDEEYEYFLDETDLIARVNDSGGRIAQLSRAAVHHRPAPSPTRTAAGATRHWRPLHQEPRLFRPAQRRRASFARRRPARGGRRRGELSRRRRARRLPRGPGRLDKETRYGVAAGLLAAERPRQLMHAAAPPPPFRPFPLPEPPGGRLCLAFVSRDYPPGHNGGVARNMQELAQALAALGHRPHVFTLARGAPSLDFEAGVWVHRVAFARGRAAAARRPAAPLGLFAHDVRGGRGARHRPPRRLRLRPAVGRRAHRLPARAALSRSITALQTTLDYWLDSQPALPQRPRLDARARRPPARAGAVDFATRAAPARQQPRHRRRYRAALRAGVRPRPPLLRPARPRRLAAEARPPRADAELRFLFVGRLESRKGIDTLLAAAPRDAAPLPPRADRHRRRRHDPPPRGRHAPATRSPPMTASSFTAASRRPPLRAHYRDLRRVRRALALRILRPRVRGSA